MLKPVEHTNCTPLSYLNGNSLSSFLDSLLQSLIEPVLQVHTPAAPAPEHTEPAESRPTWLTGNELSAFLASLQSEVEHLARNLYYRVKMSVALEDIVQEGMIAAWQATHRYDAAKVVDERSFTGYCIKRARGAMLNYLTRLNRTPAISLDDYLEVDTDDGPTYLELADTPVQHRQATLSERRRILAALRQLTENERLVILAHFRIDDSNGRCLSPETVQARLKLSDSAYYSTRARAVKKLSTILQPN